MDKTDQNTLSTEIETWLKIALKREHLKTFSVKFVGNSEAGEGYLGDILFVHVSGENSSGSKRDYDLVLKCGKRSPTLRQNAPVSITYKNEIYVYETVFPTLFAFQKRKGLLNIFDSVPKCYGHYLGEAMEVVVLEDLKTAGYEMNDRRKPLTTRHLRLVLKEYGRWHATSAAFKAQHPREFGDLAKELVNVWAEFSKSSDMGGMYRHSAQLVANLLEGELDEVSRQKWRNLQKSVSEVTQTMVDEHEGMAVLTHGDCWNNNFMYKSDSNGFPLEVKILDWQLVKPSNPVFDLAYFLYTGISEEDIEDFDDLLKIYHDSFSSHLRALGSDPEELYPFPQLLVDWKRFAKMGIIQASLLIKIMTSDDDETPDVEEGIEKSRDFSDTFKTEVKDPSLLKHRMKYIIEHAVKRNFI